MERLLTKLQEDKAGLDAESIIDAAEDDVYEADRKIRDAKQNRDLAKACLKDVESDIAAHQSIAADVAIVQASMAQRVQGFFKGFAKGALMGAAVGGLGGMVAGGVSSHFTKPASAVAARSLKKKRKRSSLVPTRPRSTKRNPPRR